VQLTLPDDTDEGSFFAVNAFSPSDITEFFLDNYPHLSTSNAEAINTHYPLTSPLPLHAAFFPSASAAYGESTFTCPGNFISSSVSSHLSPSKVYNYRYNVQDDVLINLGLGVPHTFESPAIFGVGNAGDDVRSSYTTYNKDIVPVVMNYWISFVRALDPNVFRYAEAPKWVDWGVGKGTREGRRLMIETGRTGMEAVTEEQVQRCVFWRSLGEEMRH